MNPKPKLSLVIYSLGLGFSLFAIIPMNLNVVDFNGYCILYSKGNVTLNSSKSTSSKLSTISWGNSSNCYFVLYMGYAVLVATVALLWQSVVFVWKEYDRSPFSSFLVFIGNGIILLGLFIAALITTVGYSRWCDHFSQRDTMCENLDLSELNVKYGINPSRLYSNIMIAEFGLWSSCLVWLLAFLMSFFKVRHFHSEDDLLQSLAHEKEKLFTRKRYTHVRFEENA